MPGDGRGGGRRTAACAESRSLERQGGVGDRPAVVEITDAGVVVHAGLGEEHLVEEGTAGHLAQRAYLDPLRLVHVDGEVGDALVLGHIGVGPGDEHAHVGDLAAGGPHLLSGDDPLVAVADGPRLQASQVGARTRLAEELAPGVPAGDDRLHEALDLLLRAVRGDGRGGEQQAQATGSTEGAELGDRLLHADRVGAVEPLAVGVLGQTGCGPAGGAQALPPLADRQVGVPLLLEPGLTSATGSLSVAVLSVRSIVSVICPPARLRKVRASRVET